MSEKFLTAQEIAERRNVKPVTVRVWLKRGLFPNAKLEEVPPLGKIWRVPESDLENFSPPVKTGRPKRNSKAWNLKTLKNNDKTTMKRKSPVEYGNEAIAALDETNRLLREMLNASEIDKPTADKAIQATARKAAAFRRAYFYPKPGAANIAEVNRLGIVERLENSIRNYNEALASFAETAGAKLITQS